MPDLPILLVPVLVMAATMVLALVTLVTARNEDTERRRGRLTLLPSFRPLVSAWTAGPDDSRGRGVPAPWEPAGRRSTALDVTGILIALADPPQRVPAAPVTRGVAP